MALPQDLQRHWRSREVLALRDHVERWILRAEETHRATRSLKDPELVGTLLVLAADPLSGSRRVWNVPFERLTRYALSHQLAAERLEWFLDRGRLLLPNAGVLATQGEVTPRLWVRVLAEERAEHTRSVVRWAEERNRVLQRIGRRTVELVLRDLPTGTSREEVTSVLEEVLALSAGQDEILQALLCDREESYMVEWGENAARARPVTELVEAARLV